MENLTKIKANFNPESSRFNIISRVKNFREKAKNESKQELVRVISAFEIRENVDFVSIANGQETILRTSSAFSNCIRLAHKLNIITKQEFLAVKESLIFSFVEYDHLCESAVNKILGVYNKVKIDNV
jgi:hypothetical protein